jgi:hypothetical protein
MKRLVFVLVLAATVALSFSDSDKVNQAATDDQVILFNERDLGPRH